MSVKVIRYRNETDDDLIKRFNHNVTQSGILVECELHSCFLPKQVKQKLKKKLNFYRNKH
jgi:ribosomal protein S21